MEEEAPGDDVVRILSRACHFGSGAGCAHLAFMYASGRLVERDDGRATPLYVRSCDLGDARGCFNVGIMFGRSLVRKRGLVAAVVATVAPAVGVMPAGCYFPKPRDVWTTIDDAGKRPDRSTQFFHAIGRLEPGVTLDRAQREMDAVSAAIAEDKAVEHSYGVRLVSRLDEMSPRDPSGTQLAATQASHGRIDGRRPIGVCAPRVGSEISLLRTPEWRITT